nr:DUF4340 domain-containing protein [Bacteroidota bacterium]
MFKKLNVKTLIIILIVLVAIYYIADMIGDKERSFRSEVVSVDTANVTAINISILKDNAEIKLVKTNDGSGWEVVAEGNKYNADNNVVKTILGQLTDLKPERVAATVEKKWAEYEVSDSTSVRVVLLDGKKELVDIYIGKFSYTQPPQSAAQNQYQQQRGKMTSFVRVANEDEVYAVEGFLKMSYQKDVNSYRNKQLINVNKDDLSRLVFNYPDNANFTLSKSEEGKWLIDGALADSAKTAGYINKIFRLNSSNFVDPSTPKMSDATHKLRLEGNNFTPIEIKAFPSDTTVQFVVTSSINPGAEFDGSKATLYEKVFVTDTEFFPDPE